MSNYGGKRKMGKGGKTKNGYAGGGMMQVKKLYNAGGKTKTRGCGAATKGRGHSKKMG